MGERIEEVRVYAEEDEGWCRRCCLPLVVRSTPSDEPKCDASFLIFLGDSDWRRLRVAAGADDVEPEEFLSRAIHRLVSGAAPEK